MPNLLQIIMYLVNKIKWQNTLIQLLNDYIAWLEEDRDRQPKGSDITKLDYNKLLIDDPPRVVKIERSDYKILLKEAEEAGKPIKPVRRHKSSSKVPEQIHCAKCRAPHTYLYKNNGSHGQYQCKICSAFFNEKSRYSKDVLLKCSHCEKSLEKIKQRSKFDIYKCKNDSCPYYLNSLNELNEEQKILYNCSPYYLKLRYIYRQFHLELKDIKSYGLI